MIYNNREMHMILMEMSSQGYRLFVENVLKNFINYDYFKYFFDKSAFYGVSSDIHFNIDLTKDCDVTNFKKNFSIILNKNEYEKLDLIGHSSSVVKFTLNDDSVTVSDESSYCSIYQYGYIKDENLMFKGEYDVNRVIASRILNNDFVKKNAKVLMKKEQQIPKCEIYVQLENDEKLGLVGFGNENVKKSFDINLMKELSDNDFDYTIHTNSLGLTKYKEIEIAFHKLTNVTDPRIEPVYLLKSIQKVTDLTNAEVVEKVLDMKNVKR